MKQRYIQYQIIISILFFTIPTHSTSQSKIISRVIDIAYATKKPSLDTTTARSINLIQQVAENNSMQKATAFLKKFTHKKKILKKAKYELDTSTMKVQEVTLALDLDGYPTIDAIKQLFLDLYFPKHLATDLKIESIEGGAFSEKLYRISIQGKINKNIFFVKISSRTGSALNLEKLQKGPVGRLGIDTKYVGTNTYIPKKNLPIMIWTEQFFSYQDAQGQTRFIEVTHSAHGQPVYSILTDEYNPKLKEICMYRIGITLGSFQQAFMNYHGPRLTTPANQWTTICHHDFHGNNILFDPKTLRVYFIDNETMSPDYCHIDTDLSGLLVLNYYEIFYNLEIYSWLWKSWYQDSLSFFKGYIASFPDDQKSAVALYLQQKIASIDPDFHMPILQKTFQGYFKNIVIQFSSKVPEQYQLHALHLAVAKGQIKQVQLLLKEGANVNSKDNQKDTPLDLAIINGNQAMITLLAHHGADINAPDQYGYTPLGYAASINATKTIATLLRLGANVNAFSKDQQAALYFAVKYSNKSAVAALLAAKNINVNIQDKDGTTPLRAIMQEYHNHALQLSAPMVSNFLEIAQMLLDTGASTTIKNNDGDTPLKFDTEDYAKLLKISAIKA